MTKTLKKRTVAYITGLLADGKAAMGLTSWARSAEEPGSDPREVALAHVVHTKTTVSQGWIAE